MVDLKDQWHLHWILFQTWEDSTKNTGDETWDYCLDSEILLVQKPVLSTFEEREASKVKHQEYPGHPSVQKRDCSQETGSSMPNKKNQQAIQQHLKEQACWKYNCRSRTGWFTVTICQCTMFCQCSNSGPFKTSCHHPLSSFYAWIGPQWLQVSKNKIPATRMSFPAQPWKFLKNCSAPYMGFQKLSSSSTSTRGKNARCGLCRGLLQSENHNQ